VYLPTFLQRAYGVALAQLAVALALVALGNLVGTHHRRAHRRSHAASTAESLPSRWP
jgi:hypothetical protein